MENKEIQSKVTGVVQDKKVFQEVWGAIMMISQLIAVAAQEEISGKQKQALVVEDIMEYLKKFDIPLPVYILQPIVTAGVEQLYRFMVDMGLLPKVGGGKD